MPHKNQKLCAKGLEYQVLFYFKKDSSKQVFKALRHHPSTGLKQEVLVKLFLKDLYKEEFESLSKVNSPYCVRLLGFETLKSKTGSKKALILEYIKGVSLYQLLEHFHLSQDEKAYLLSEIYKALKDIHYFGLCHGDLSLNNVLIDAKAQIKMIDFGQANYKKAGYGTAPFVAPELLKGFRPQFLSDLYALGVLEAVLQNQLSLSDLNKGPDNQSFKQLENSSVLLSSDPTKREFVDNSNPDFDKSSLSLKVKELLSVLESRRCDTAKNRSLWTLKKGLMGLLKPALLSLFLMGFLGASPQKTLKSYGLIKVYTNEWFFIKSSKFQSYTPAHFFVPEGSYWLKWESRLSKGKAKIYVAKEKTLILGDEFFLRASKKPQKASQPVSSVKGQLSLSSHR